MRMRLENINEIEELMNKGKKTKIHNQNTINQLIMEITAIYRGHSEVTEGTSQGGNAWRKCAFIFETTGDFSKTVAFNVMNATIENFLQLQPGRIYTVLFDLSSREYNGKWYTDAKAWGVKDMAAADTPAPSLMQPQPKAVQTSLKMAPQPFSDANLNVNDDLPF